MAEMWRPRAFHLAGEEAKSFLVRAADPRVGRAQTLALSPAGRALVPELAALANANEVEVFDHLAPDDRAALLRILREIVDKRGLKSPPREDGHS